MCPVSLPPQKKKNPSPEVCSAPFPKSVTSCSLVQGEKKTNYRSKTPCCSSIPGKQESVGQSRSAWRTGEERKAFFCHIGSGLPPIGLSPLLVFWAVRNPRCCGEGRRFPPSEPGAWDRQRSWNERWVCGTLPGRTRGLLCAEEPWRSGLCLWGRPREGSPLLPCL